MAKGVHLWSKTAASNDGIDASPGGVSWPEGMAPAQVNDSARATMASVATWRDDLNGTLVTGGSSTAYTLSTNQGFGSLVAGLEVAFQMDETCGATVTLNVDGLGAKPLRSAAGIELRAGDLVAGTPYRATYYASNGGEWLVHSFRGEPFSIPLGASIDYWGTSAPNSYFAFPYGQAISRSTYAALFALIGTTYGSGDGSTTFNLPDVRGRARVGKDDMGGSSANRLTNQTGGLNGDTLGATGGTETHTLTEAQLASHTHTATVTDPGHQHTLEGTSGTYTGGANNFFAVNDFGSGSSSFMLAATTGITVANSSTGSGSAHNNVQPSIVCNVIMRIL